MSDVSVLFVDDDVDLIDMMSIYFSAASRHDLFKGVSFEKQFDPVLAAELLEKNQYAVVVSDYVMPRMDGEQLLTRVRERQPLATRILLSGTHVQGGKFYPSNSTVPSDIAHYAFTKPVDLNALECVIQKEVLAYRAQL